MTKEPRIFVALEETFFGPLIFDVWHGIFDGMVYLMLGDQWHAQSFAQLSFVVELKSQMSLRSSKGALQWWHEINNVFDLASFRLFQGHHILITQPNCEVLVKNRYQCMSLWKAHWLLSYCILGIGFIDWLPGRKEERGRGWKQGCVMDVGVLGQQKRRQKDLCVLNFYSSV